MCHPIFSTQINGCDTSFGAPIEATLKCWGQHLQVAQRSLALAVPDPSRRISESRAARLDDHRCGVRDEVDHRHCVVVPIGDVEMLAVRADYH